MSSVQNIIYQLQPCHKLKCFCMQSLHSDDADVQRDEEMEVERKKREEDVGPAVTSTPVAVAQDSSSEAVTEGGVTPIISHVKTEQAELTTPLDTSTASSSFISSLKVWNCLYWKLS